MLDVAADVNTSGTVTASQLYGPYGAVRYQNGTLPTDYAFTHQRSDATSGLDYYNARYYDPVAGQFTSADTARDGLNRYAYVHDNPETHTDPTGHCVPLCTFVAGLIVGAIIGVAVGVANHENAQAIFVDAVIGAGTGAIIGATLGAGLAAAGVGVAGEGAAAVAGVGAVGGAAAEEAEQELPPTVTDPTDIKDTDTIRTNMQYAKQLRGTTANGGFMKIRGRSELIWEGNTDGPDPIGGPNTAKYQGACVESRCATAATNLDNISEGDTVDIYYNHVNKKPMCGACLWNTQLAANRTGATFNVFGNNGRVYTFSPGGVLADLYPEKDVPYVRWASNSQISVWGLR